MEVYRDLAPSSSESLKPASQTPLSRSSSTTTLHLEEEKILFDSEILQTKSTRHKHWWTHLSHTIASLICGVYVLMVAFAAVDLTRFLFHDRKPHWNPTHFAGFPIRYDDMDYGLPYISCPTGNPSTARDAGCVFDVVAVGWIPRPCFDETPCLDVLRPVIEDGVDYGYYFEKVSCYRVSKDRVKDVSLH